MNIQETNCLLIIISTGTDSNSLLRKKYILLTAYLPLNVLQNNCECKNVWNIEFRIIMNKYLHTKKSDYNICESFYVMCSFAGIPISLVTFFRSILTALFLGDLSFFLQKDSSLASASRLVPYKNIPLSLCFEIPSY